MLFERLPEKLIYLVKLLSLSVFMLYKMLFSEPPDDRRKRFRVPMPSLWLSLLASAAFLSALILVLYWLLTTLAG